MSDLTGSGVIELHGMRVAVSICYEDFLACPVFVSFARWAQPQILASIANNWFATDLNALWIQRRSVELWARLFGAPLVRVVNVDIRYPIRRP